MRTLGEPYRIVLRYLQPYERQVIALMQNGALTMTESELSYQLGVNNYTEACVLFTPNRSKIIQGAIEGGHFELFMQHKMHVQDMFVIHYAARFGQLKILKLYTEYLDISTISAAQHCHVECVQHMLYPGSELVQKCIDMIDYTNPRGYEMLSYLSRFSVDHSINGKKIQLAMYNCDAVSVQQYIRNGTFRNPTLGPVIRGGSMIILKMILDHFPAVDPFLAMAAKYNRTDMMQLAKSRGEGTTGAVDDVIIHDHIEAFELLFGWRAIYPTSCYIFACVNGAYKIVKFLQHYAVPEGLVAAKKNNHEAIVDLINCKFQAD